MILAVTPNPALDLTYRVAEVTVHGEHRVSEVLSAAGGKGVNVARVLAQLGVDATCAGPLGGAVGDHVRQLLDTVQHVQQAWTVIQGPSRRTVTVVDGAGATGFNEPGPPMTADDLIALEDNLIKQLNTRNPRVEAVTISGSLPPGFDDEFLARLIRTVRDSGRPVLVDTSGPALLAAARAGAALLKPNAREALEVTGASTPVAAARSLIELGAERVVCSLGADGMLGIEQGPSGIRAWRAKLPYSVPGNPTGAGDSVVAVLASTVLTGATDLPQALLRAVAVGASAVTQLTAGVIDLNRAHEFESHTVIEEVPCP